MSEFRWKFRADPGVDIPGGGVGSLHVEFVIKYVRYEWSSRMSLLVLVS